MSASREKKQRQNAGPSQKAIKDQQEQAARRRTTIIYSVIAAVIAVLVAALLTWRSGFFQARATAVTIGDETLTAAELSFYYYGSESRQTAVYLAAYNMSAFNTALSDEDQFYNEAEGITYHDYFLEEAVKNAQQDKAQAEEALKQGHTEDEVKDSVKAYVDNMKSQAASNGISYGSYLRQVFGPYMNSSVYEKLVTRALLASLVSSDKSTELFDSYTQADLNAYYEENKDSLDTVEYSYLYFPIATVSETDADGNELSEEEVDKLKEEAQADAKKNAEEALEAVENGSSFDSQKDKYELTAAADHTKTVGTASISTTFSEQLLALDEDECDLVETDNGYYVISFHSRYLEDEPTRDVRHVVILAENGTDEEGNAVAPTDEAWAAAKERMDAVEAEWNAGDKTEEAFIALVEKYSDQSTNGGLQSRIASDNTTLVPEFKDWTFEDHQPGDSGVIQHNAEDSDSNKYWAYHLMFYVGENEPVWMGTVRTTLASEDLQAWRDELSANYPTTLASGANYLGK